MKAYEMKENFFTLHLLDLCKLKIFVCFILHKEKCLNMDFIKQNKKLIQFFLIYSKF